jgi:CheY-like chemotaxis protein
MQAASAEDRTELPAELGQSGRGASANSNGSQNVAEANTNSHFAKAPPALKPAPKSEVHCATTPWITAEQWLSELKVVVVEDDFDTLDLVVSILCGCGAQVAAVTNVREAIRIVESWNPDLLLSDIGLPDEDGLSLIRKLRTRPDTADLCAVAVSAYSSQENVREALSAGFHAYITKPFDATHLAELLSQIFKHRSATHAETSHAKPIGQRF